jgi:DNA invertase Pin-like site-specific DNA recombinase
VCGNPSISAERARDQPRSGTVAAVPICHHHVAGILLDRRREQQGEIARNRNWVLTALDLEIHSGQTDALTKTGARIYTDKLSGTSTRQQRPGLAALLDYAREGDAIVVVGIDRLGRNPPRS